MYPNQPFPPNGPNPFFNQFRPIPPMMARSFSPNPSSGYFNLPQDRGLSSFTIPTLPPGFAFGHVGRLGLPPQFNGQYDPTQLYASPYDQNNFYSDPNLSAFSHQGPSTYRLRQPSRPPSNAFYPGYRPPRSAPPPAPKPAPTPVNTGGIDDLLAQLGLKPKTKPGTNEQAILDELARLGIDTSSIDLSQSITPSTPAEKENIGLDNMSEDELTALVQGLIDPPEPPAPAPVTTPSPAPSPSTSSPTPAPPPPSDGSFQTF